MKSSEKSTNNKQGSAIARAILEQTAQKERNMQKAAKRKETMLHKAAESIFRDYSV